MRTEGAQAFECLITLHYFRTAMLSTAAISREFANPEVRFPLTISIRQDELH